MQEVHVAERHEVEHRRGRPQTRSRHLDQELQAGNLRPQRLLLWGNYRRSGHWPNYTALSAIPRFPNQRCVLKYFLGFETFGGCIASVYTPGNEMSGGRSVYDQRVNQTLHRSVMGGRWALLLR